MVSAAVAVSSRDVGTPALINCAGAVADSACIELPYAVVYVIAYAIAIGIGRARSTADAEGIELVSIAVAVSSGDVGTAALVDGAWASTFSAII